jgi:soluble lytic murein transglycosylase
MLKNKKIWMPIVLGLGAMSFGVGILVSTTVKTGKDGKPIFVGLTPFGNSTKPLDSNRIGAPSPIVTPIVTQTPQQRAEVLKQTAQNNSPSLDRNRARYVLATDLLASGKGGEAIEQLKDLEKDYSVLGAQILLKRARAFEVSKQPAEATKLYQAIVQQYPKDPTAAEAFSALALQDPKFYDPLFTQFPAHPDAIAAAKARLRQNPQQTNLQYLLAKHDLEAKDYSDRTDKFVQAAGNQLSPDQWESIAFGYWENQKYDKAADAYAKAPQTALTLYRSARGLHLSGKSGATDRYQLTVKTFPGTPEAGLALSRLVSIAEKPQDAIAYTDLILASYPDYAAQALLDKAKALDKLNSGDTAKQTRQTLLEKYSDSEAAANLRWTIAQQQAKANQFNEAKKWADAVIAGNPKSELAPQAGFWAGKWAMKLGQPSDASQHFQTVISARPESYYAWRSASLLGWKVGDFDTVRQLTPQIQKPKLRAELPAGSQTVRELHQLGQDRDAWSYWQVEHQNRVQPTVAEQFTDGVMRLGIGDNLDGIFMIGHLSERIKADEKQQLQQLQQQAGYWQALYPFPFVNTIETWSRDRQINPMLVTALIRQESRFEPKIQSAVGATGLMQVMPETATYIAEKTNTKKYTLDNIDDNIKFGTWYLGYTHQEYQGNSMLAVASYNAGPGAVSDWVSKSKTQDADEFVETIPYDETQGYVKSVFGNYWNYMRLYNPEIAKQVAQTSQSQPKDLF